MRLTDGGKSGMDLFRASLRVMRCVYFSINDDRGISACAGTLREILTKAGFPYAFAAALISAAAFSAIMIVGELVLPEVMVGMIEASAIRRPASPRNRN